MRPGVPLNINGRTAGTPGPATVTPLKVELWQPGMQTPVNLQKKPATATSLKLRHYSGAGDLKVFIPGQADFISVKPNESFTYDGLLQSFIVQASTGTVEWEGVAEIH